MKKLVLLVVLLASITSYSQGVLEVDGVDYIELTTTERNLLNTETGKVRLIFNKTNDQFELFNGVSWVALDNDTNLTNQQVKDIIATESYLTTHQDISGKVNLLGGNSIDGFQVLANGTGRIKGKDTQNIDRNLLFIGTNDVVIAGNSSLPYRIEGGLAAPTYLTGSTEYNIYHSGNFGEAQVDAFVANNNYMPSIFGSSDDLRLGDGTITSLSDILSAASGGERYTWSNNTERDAQTGMVADDMGVVVVDRKKYRYNGTSWVFMYDLDASHNHDVRYYTQAEIDAFSFSSGAHTVDTDTNLTEAQVNAYVDANNYIRLSDISGKVNLLGGNSIDGFQVLANGTGRIKAKDTQNIERNLLFIGTNDVVIAGNSSLPYRIEGSAAAPTYLTGSNEYNIYHSGNFGEAQVDAFVANNNYITAHQDLSSYALSSELYDSFNTDFTAKSTSDLSEGINLYYTNARVSANTDVVANTAKIGITSTQAANITTNNAKVGYTDAAVTSLIDKPYVDALSVDADSLGGVVASDYAKKSTDNNFAKQTIIAAADGYQDLLVFDTDRDWKFRTNNVNASTSLDLVDLNGNKSFKIVDNVYGGVVSFYNGNIVASNSFIGDGSQLTNIPSSAVDLSSYALGSELYDSFNTDFTAKSTSDLSEGINLYYTNARVSANTDVVANTAKVTYTDAKVENVVTKTYVDALGIDAQTLGGVSASDYYNTANSNLYNIDWNVKNLIADNDILMQVGGVVNSSAGSVSFSDSVTDGDLYGIKIKGSAAVTVGTFADDELVMITNSKVNINTDAVVSGETASSTFKVNDLNAAPASSTAPGNTGEIRYTADYIYVCVASNTWKRSALISW